MNKKQPISDKDFDKLFHEKLYSFETEPTDAVWANITQQLDGKEKKKREFPILWIAASSMAAIIGLGMWLAAHEEPMKLTGSVQPEKTIKQQALPQNSTIAASPVLPEKTVEITSDANVVQPKSVQITAAVKQPEKVSSKTTKLKTPTMATETAREETAKNTSPASKEASNEPEDIIASKPVQTLALAANDDSQPDDNATERKQKRIKSVGSLVNFVVGQVDRRKEKIIEFQDNDEGTKVSGLNFGLLKYKSKD